MLKKLTAFLTAAVMVTSVASIPVLTSYADTNSTTEKRVMEKLDRGTVAVKTNDGVYLSWRLLGTESLTNQAFDIYRDSEKIYTTGEHDATCYTDSKGTADNKYTVVPKGEAIDKTEAVDVWTTNTTYKGRSVAYKDIAFKVPDGGKTPTDEEYTYTANDMSVGDLDGDGEYEYIVKWDPSNSKDNSVKGYTGNVYLDAYELDGTLLWRIDLGVNIRAGAHYTQYMVYDFDGDGKSEVILKTAPGSKDGEGNYVSKAGKNITKGDDKKDYRNSSGLLMGKDGGPEYLTVFNGETGAAMQTVDFDPPRSILTSSEWGDSYANRSERYLAAVAYLDGVHPSVVMTRGYYTYVYAAAYTWDGTDLKEQWLSTNTPTEENGGTGCTVKYADGTSKNNTNKTLYAQGAHSVSVADVDNDGYDEIIFGSAVLDHDGTVLTYDGRGHGDAEHVSDFDNDGKQEIFMAHEAGKHNDKIIPYAVDIKRYNGDIMLQAAKGDIGRGIMDNVDDKYALSSGNLSLFWSVAADGIYNQAGKKLTSATLKLYDKFTNTDKRNSVLHLDYCSKNDWDEATVTINDIKTRGEDTPLSSLGLQVSPAYNVDYKEISFDVTDVIKEKCTDNLITFTLWTGTGREQVIASKEYSGTDAQGPTLVLEFEGEEPTPTPTVVPTATPTLKPTATPTVVPTATPTLKPTATPAVTSTLKPTTIPTAIPTVIPTTTPNLANNKITAMINSNNKLDVTLDFENVDMNDVNVYVAFKNNGKLVGMKMPQASELKGIDLIDKEYTDIEVYAWDNKQKPYANIVRIVNNVQ